MAAPTTSSSSKVKILVFGSIGDGTDSIQNNNNSSNSNVRVAWLVQRLNALHRSKAGPFDAAFVVGSCAASDAHQLRRDAATIPIPVYLHHLQEEDVVAAADNISGKKNGGDNDKGTGCGNNEGNEAKGDNDETATNEEDSTAQQEQQQLPHEMGTNLFALVIGDDGSSAGIWSIPIHQGGVRSGGTANQLVVAACPPRIRTDDSRTQQCSSLMRSVRHVSYRGCDLLLTVEPPQGAEALLVAPSGGLAPATSGSFDVADVALRARPRYHFFPAHFYRQSSPFAHVAAATATADLLYPPGRLLALGPVSDSKDKDLKFVHALGMTPLLAMSTTDLQQAQGGGGGGGAAVLPCPYTDTSYETDGRRPSDAAGKTSSSSLATGGLSEASARRILAEERQKRALDGSSRWTQSNSRSRGAGGGGGRGADPDDADPSNTTLFLHGLHKDASGRLQSPEGDVVLLRAFARFGATTVRKPPGAVTSSFAFVELQSHGAAARCLQETGGEVTVGGVHLTIKWATQHGAEGGGRPAKKPRGDHQHARMTEAEAKDSTALYFKLVQTDHDEANGEAMRSWAEQILEAALNEGAASEEDRVTAKDEPALRVEVRVMDAFGFLDFASHAAASMVIATLTGSVDGGQVVPHAENESTSRPESLQPVVIFVHWARAKSSKAEQVDNVIEDSSGFKFERKHFPADSRLDCWFCLASEACEKHLITGVYDTCYAAMPKGPVHPGHVLLVPIRHSSQGSLLDGGVVSEMERLKDKLRDHAASKYDCDLFVFERAIQTRGGYHTHVQCVPVERQLGLRLVTTMMAQAQKTGMDLREITSDIGAAALLAEDENASGDDGGYFYAEIPMGSGCRRFLHRQVPGRHRGGTVPLQFGREVLAAVLGKPDMAHWKSCLLDKDQESKLANEFRESFVV